MTTPLNGNGWFCLPLTGNALFAGGEVGAVLNPEGETIIIQKAVLYIETATTVAATTLSVGLAANATTSATDICNAVAIDAGAGTAQNCLAADDAKEALLVMTGVQYITATGSADSSAFVGKLYVKYVHA